MKKILCGLLTSLSILSAPVAKAEAWCNGCNVVDADMFGRQMIGYTAYFENSIGDYNNVRVVDVDVYAERVIYVGSDGKRYWIDANQVYSRKSKNERVANAAGAVVTVAGVALIICMFSPESCQS